MLARFTNGHYHDPLSERLLRTSDPNGNEHSKLYGREQQIKTLENALERAKKPSEPAQIVFVTGESGTGKSALVEHAFSSVAVAAQVEASTTSMEFLRVAPPPAAAAAAPATFSAGEKPSSGGLIDEDDLPEEGPMLGPGAATMAPPAVDDVGNPTVLLGTGKFEEMPDPKPFAALLSAVADICRTAFALDQDQGHEDDVVAARLKRVEQALDAEALDTLVAILPELSMSFDGISNGMISLNPEHRDNFERHSRSREGLERVKYALKQFLRVLASPSTPIVLCLDDLQCMDPETFSILKTIVVDSRLTNFLFVGCYTDDSEDDDLNHSHHASFRNSTNSAAGGDGTLIKWMSELKSGAIATQCPPIFLSLENLTQTQVVTLLVDVLQAHNNPTGVQELAVLIHKRTQGNIFHILQLLDLLQREGLLGRSPNSFQYKWKLERIRSETGLTDNVVDLVHKKMVHLPAPVQAVLKVCSVLGSRFSERILQEVEGAIPKVDEIVQVEEPPAVSESKSNEEQQLEATMGGGDAEKNIEWTLDNCIALLVDAGILEHFRESKLKFVHGRIHEAAVTLAGVNPEDRAPLHANIGMCLWHRLGFPGTLKKILLQKDDRRLFVCADQLNHGRSALDFSADKDFAIHLAELNNQASKRAAAYSAFVPSLNYLRAGIAVLDPQRCWTENYDLSLTLYQSLAEMSLSSGRHDECKEAVREVQKHATGAKTAEGSGGLFDELHDRMPASMILVECLAAQAQNEEQVKTSLALLKDLAEPPLPLKQTDAQMRKGLDKTRKFLMSKTDESILSLRTATDVHKKAALRVMCGMEFPLEMLGDFKLIVAVVCRMVHLTFEYGLSEYSPLVFALVATTLNSHLEDIDLAYRFSTLAIRLLDGQSKKGVTPKHASKVYLHVNMILHWREPLSITIDHWIEAHKKGMRVGEITASFINATAYCMTYFYSGLPIEPLISDVKNFCSLMEEYGNRTQLLQSVPLYQCLLNLTGQSEDVLETSQGIALATRKRVGWECRSGEQADWSYAMQIAVYCEEFDLATRYYRKVEPLFAGISRGLPLYHSRVFFFTLICIHNAKKTGSRKEKKEAHRHYKVVRAWVTEKKALNVTHKLMILDAAMMTLDPPRKARDQAITESFEKAIVAATRAGFFQDAALAAHIASQSFPRNEQLREDFFGRACELYIRWGATGVVDYLCKTPQHSDNSYESAPGVQDTQKRRLGFRSRPHFDWAVAEEHRSLDLVSRRHISQGKMAVSDNKLKKSLSKGKSEELTPTTLNRYKTT